MSENKYITDPTERRRKARNCRALLRIDDPKERKTVDQVADIHKISRATLYRIIDELEAWEMKSSFQQEAADINVSYPKYSPTKWLLVSGRMLLAYMQGEISATLMGSDAPEQDDLLA